MATKKAPKAKPAARRAPAKSGGFTAAERAAMRERAHELKAGRAADGDAAVREKISGMPKPDRVIAERLHAIVGEVAPQLSPRLWYGMPAYAERGKVLCFFQAASKFKTRYATLGFSDVARLDDGATWPVVFALAEMSPVVEKKVRALLKKATKP